jgi:hypothetical protein
MNIDFNVKRWETVKENYRRCLGKRSHKSL